MAAFDVSVEGFWRSFLAFLLILPAALVGAAAELRLIAERDLPADVGEVSEPAYYFVQTLEALVAWIALPLVLALLARPLGIERRYVAFVVARNWAAVIEAVLFAVPALLYIAGLIGAGALANAVLFALGFGIYYAVQVARFALMAPASIVATVVTLNLLLSLVIGLGLNRLFF